MPSDTYFNRKDSEVFESHALDAAKSLISPPPEETLRFSNKHPRNGFSSGSSSMNFSPTKPSKRKRTPLTTSSNTNDNGSSASFHHTTDSASTEPIEGTPNPKARKHVRSRPRTDPSVEMESPTRAKFSPASKPKPEDTALLRTSSGPIDPRTRLMPPPPIFSTSRRSFSSRRRSATPVVVPPYEPPEEKFMPPREVLGTPLTAASTRTRKTDVKNKTAEGLRITIKKEMPEIDLTRPIDPPSPSDDPILLHGPPVMAKRRAKERKDAGSQMVLPKAQSSPARSRENDVPAATGSRNGSERGSSGWSTAGKSTSLSVFDLSTMSSDIYNRNFASDSDSAGEGDDSKEFGETGQYTGRYTTLTVPTKGNPPTISANDRSARWDFLRKPGPWKITEIPATGVVTAGDTEGHEEAPSNNEQALESRVVDAANGFKDNQDQGLDVVQDWNWCEQSDSDVGKWSFAREELDQGFQLEAGEKDDSWVRNAASRDLQQEFHCGWNTEYSFEGSSVEVHKPDQASLDAHASQEVNRQSFKASGGAHTRNDEPSDTPHEPSNSQLRSAHAGRPQDAGQRLPDGVEMRPELDHQLPKKHDHLPDIRSPSSVRSINGLDEDYSSNQQKDYYLDYKMGDAYDPNDSGAEPERLNGGQREEGDDSFNDPLHESRRSLGEGSSAVMQPSPGSVYQLEEIGQRAMDKTSWQPPSASRAKPQIAWLQESPQAGLECNLKHPEASRDTFWSASAGSSPIARTSPLFNDFRGIHEGSVVAKLQSAGGRSSQEAIADEDQVPSHYSMEDDHSTSLTSTPQHGPPSPTRRWTTNKVEVEGERIADHPPLRATPNNREMPVPVEGVGSLISPARFPSSETHLVWARDDNILPDPASDPLSEGSSEDESSSEVSVGVVKITSHDPMTAARAAAILKLHDYDWIPGVTKRDRFMSPNLESAARRSRRSSVLSSGVSKVSNVRSRRATTEGLIGNSSSARSSPALGLPELLEEAEVTLGRETPVRSPSTFTAVSNLPPGFVRSTAPSSSSCGGRRTGVTIREWTRADWKHLDACFTDERLRLGAQNRSGDNNLSDVDKVNLVDVVTRFVSTMGGFDAVDALGPAWTIDSLLIRAKALRKKQGLMDARSGERIGVASPARSDFSDFLTTGHTPCPSKRQNRPNVPPPIIGPPFEKFTAKPPLPPSLLTPGYSHLLEAVDVKDTSPSVSSGLRSDLPTCASAVSKSLSEPNTLNGLSQRVQGLLFSYFGLQHDPAPLAPRAQFLRPGLPLPPTDILERPRGPITTPARPPPPKPTIPKELVTLQPAPPLKPSLIPRITKPQRLVELQPTPPHPPSQPTITHRPRRSSGSSVKDLVESFENLKPHKSVEQGMQKPDLRRTRSVGDTHRAFVGRPVWRL